MSSFRLFHLLRRFRTFSHARTPEGWRLRTRATRQMIEPSVAPRSNRSLEGLLLGTPPSGRRRRRRRGRTRRAWSEGPNHVKPPEKERRGGARSEGTVRVPKLRAAKRFQWPYRAKQRRPSVAKRSGPIVRVQYGMYSCNSTKLCQVL